MGRYIEVDSLWNCETCFHNQNGKCNTWCDSYESYRPAYDKLPIIEGELLIIDGKNNLLNFSKIKQRHFGSDNYG